MQQSGHITVQQAKNSQLNIYGRPASPPQHCQHAAEIVQARSSPNLPCCAPPPRSLSLASSGTGRGISSSQAYQSMAPSPRASSDRSNIRGSHDRGSGGGAPGPFMITMPSLPLVSEMPTPSGSAALQFAHASNVPVQRTSSTPCLGSGKATLLSGPLLCKMVYMTSLCHEFGQCQLTCMPTDAPLWIMPWRHRAAIDFGHW